MGYVGPEGHGKDLVYIFRDAGTHSQIVLQSTFATLRDADLLYFLLLAMTRLRSS